MRASFALLILPIFAAATAVPRDVGGPSNQCINGTLLCCNSLQSVASASSQVLFLLLLLGPVMTIPAGQIGVTCSPISLLGVGITSCSAQPACCTNNSFGGVIALGCTPVGLSL